MGVLDQVYIVIPPYAPNYGRVIGQFVSFEAEEGTDKKPKARPLSGTVTFTPRVTVARWPEAADPFISVAQRITAPIIDGVLRKPGYDPDVDDPFTSKGLSLVASDLPEAEPSSLQWNVSFNLSGVMSQPEPLVIDVPNMGTIDLAKVLPVKPTPGTITVVSSEDRIRAEKAAQQAIQAEAGAFMAKEEIDGILDYVSGGMWPTFNSELNEYDTESISHFLDVRRDGLAYGVRIPKTTSVVCTKVGANAGIPNPIPSVIGTPGTDPYLDKSPFFTIECNGFVDETGFPHVTALEGDPKFSRNGAQDVWILAPVLWWQQTEDEDTITFSISDFYRPNFQLQPKAFLPDGRRRPFMLYAKYALSVVDGIPRSVSGQQPQTSTISHNSLITLCDNKNTGYSGKSFADDWYHKIMFLMKYATKNSQSVFAGVSSVSGGTVDDLRPTGTCDEVPGRDGSPTNPLDPTQPFTLQGIELMLGMYEVLGDVILSNTGDGWYPQLLMDSRYASTSVTSDYINSEVEIPTTDNTWKYSLYPRSAGGLLFGDSSGGSVSTGMCDGSYINPIETVGIRQWLGLGYLTNGGLAGLWFVLGGNGLGLGYWFIGSRLSVLGRAG